MLSALQSGLAGAASFARGVDAAAQTVTRASTRAAEAVAAGPGEATGEDLAAGMVGMLVGQRGFEVNLETIRTAGEMLGTLLDLKG